MGAASEVSGKAYYLYYNALRTVYTRLDDCFIWFVRVRRVHNAPALYKLLLPVRFPCLIWVHTYFPVLVLSGTT